jgi:flagellar protein FlaG
MALEPIGKATTIQAPAKKEAESKAKAESNEKARPSSIEPAISVESAATPIAKSEKKEQGNEQGSSKEQGNVSTEQLKKAVETINKNLPNSEVAFGIHEKTNRITIKIIDKETKEVIKELPPEKTLDMIAKAWELAGLLVDERL